MPIGAFRLNTLGKVLSTPAVAATVWDDPYTMRDAVMVYDTSSQTSTNKIVGISIQDSGSKMYVLDSSTDTIYQYTLSTAYDITSASYASKSFNMGGEGDIKEDFHIADSGSKLFVCDRSGDETRRYTMSTPYDISTASFDSGQTVSHNSQDTAPRGVVVSSDGNHLFMVGSQNGNIHQYDMSSAYDLSTASFNQSFTTTLGSSYSIAVNGDGKQIWIHGDGETHEYDLSTGYDVSTAAIGKKHIRDYHAITEGMYIPEDGEYVYYVTNYGSNSYRAAQNPLNRNIQFATDSNASSMSLGLPYGYKETGLDDVTN